jgi:hypothetical protein
MRRFIPTRVLLVLAAIAVLLPTALVAGSASGQADGLTRSASYTCQYSGVESGTTVPGGLPAPVLPSFGGSDPVTVDVQVDAPKQVAPGEPLKLTGEATFTFGANATATNASTVFTFLTDSFGLVATIGTQKRFLRIAELITSRSTADSPVVTARWSLPDFLVPSTASGELTLSLPTDASVTNPVSTSPESVAFTGELQTDSALQPNRAVGCALMPNQNTAIGAVKVAAAATDGESASPSPTPTPAGDGASTGNVPASGVGATASNLPPAAPIGSAPSGVTPPVAAQPASEEAVAQAVLAVEAIPPETVPQGLRLPPWAMLFVGAFVAGGVFLAVASHRRLRQLTVGAFLLALLVVPTSLNPPAPAEAASAPAGVAVAAAPGQAQITLVCVYEAQGSDPSDVPKDQPTGLSITLEVPASVTPGEVLTLTGSASVQAPEDIRSQASQLGYTTLDAISDAFSVGLTVGSGQRQVFPADRWQTGKTAFSNPLVVSGPLYFPSFKVPADASGSIKLELPRNEVVDRRPPPYQNGNTPPKVAVEFMASVTGNGTSATYIVSCWRNDDGSGLIATIPVAKGSATTPATTPAAGSTAPAAGGQTQQPVTGAGQTVAPPAQAPAGTAADPAAGDAADPAAAPTAGQVVAGTAPGTTVGTGPALQGAAEPPTLASAQPASQDVVVPTWLAVVTVLLAAGAYGFAGWNHLRMRSLRGRQGG